MNYRFENLKELKKHIQENGIPAFAACADAEPSIWEFSEMKMLAVFSVLGLAPELILDTEEKGQMVFRVKGLDGIRFIDQVPDFVAGKNWPEAWDKLMKALDELIPQMPVSVFHPEGDPLNEFVREFA